MRSPTTSSALPPGCCATASSCPPPPRSRAAASTRSTRRCSNARTCRGDLPDPPRDPAAARGRPRGAPARDLKSVVTGKSVEGRLAHGGRRVYKIPYSQDNHKNKERNEKK